MSLHRSVGCGWKQTLRIFHPCLWVNRDVVLEWPFVSFRLRPASSFLHLQRYFGLPFAETFFSESAFFFNESACCHFLFRVWRRFRMRGVRLRLVHRSLETPAISALSARIVPATMPSARRWSDGCCPVPRHHQPFSAVTFRDGCLCNHVPARS